jgi:Domain of unknown function (DUF397)
MIADTQPYGVSLANSHWRRSTRCKINGNCVELNLGMTGLVAVRDTKSHTSIVLTFASADWTIFLRTVGIVTHQK